LRSLLNALSCVIVLTGCGDPFAESEAAFSYHVVRSNGDELTIAGPGAAWELSTITTLTGTQTVFTLSLGGGDAGDNLLRNPGLQIESQNDGLAKDKPATGAYSLVLTGDQYFRVTITTTSGGTYLADAGTVTITGSSNTTVEGRLDLHFRSNSQNPDFDLTGEFTAKRVK
jgi:hypothetical protein